MNSFPLLVTRLTKFISMFIFFNNVFKSPTNHLTDKFFTSDFHTRFIAYYQHILLVFFCPFKEVCVR